MSIRLPSVPPSLQNEKETIEYLNELVRTLEIYIADAYGQPIKDSSDVSAVSPTNNQVLAYSSAQRQWIPASVAASGGGGTQDVFITVSSDNGSVTANSPTDTIAIRGGTGIKTSVTGNTLTVLVSAAYLTNITNLVSAGTNVTITGAGTSASPYIISASSGGGGSGTSYFPGGWS